MVGDPLNLSIRSVLRDIDAPPVLMAQIGEGGMGEVYRARDSNLGRDVAIKILPRGFTADPDRLARFEREARLLASLNHPHIGAIYGVEELEGGRALVLEMVEGLTLADKLAGEEARGEGLPIPEALAIARQIADALDAAHERGIVHRDLKPANIKITPAGTVKVLDFGLAKVVAGDGSSPDLSRLPTMAGGGTRDGMILGTAAYMSPEQARGQAVDKRTDIWAFGCVLYEVASRRRSSRYLPTDRSWRLSPSRLQTLVGSGSGQSQASRRVSCPAPRGPCRSSGRLTGDRARSLRTAN